jgi:hypothetical protein
MPPAEGLTVMLRLISAMIAGVALCAVGRPDGHPVKASAEELADALTNLSEKPGDFRLEHLTQLAEEVGARIWHLVIFQADGDLKANLTELVSSICVPPARIHLLPGGTCDRQIGERDVE